MSVKMRPFLLLLLLALPLCPGCFSSKTKAPEDKAITVQIEQSFKHRWIEKRSAELIGQGKSPEEALSQSVREFRERYEFTSAAQE
ncbi:MAG: hypothetical protein K9M98_00255 [Cephaloticoccus sp.]|nr:hypothetical protein [Cephaloticoccus sp.]MCF7758914.1 hypothetical protein [Cephaloticoccus sp.]